MASLEAEIDRLESQLPPLKNFLLPGGSTAAAQVHLARAICRRTERIIVSPFAAKRLHLLLTRILREYESRYGTMEVGEKAPLEALPTN